MTGKIEMEARLDAIMAALNAGLRPKEVMAKLPYPWRQIENGIRKLRERGRYNPGLRKSTIKAELLKIAADRGARMVPITRRNLTMVSGYERSTVDGYVTQLCRDGLMQVKDNTLNGYEEYAVTDRGWMAAGVPAPIWEDS